MMTLLVATRSEIFIVDAEQGSMRRAVGLEGVRPSALAADPLLSGRVWCATRRRGIYRSEDAGESWRRAGLEDQRVTSVVGSPVEAGVVWAGTEPSNVWRSSDGGGTWERTTELATLPSSREWAFPPKPDTHHVRWIACQPREAGKLWVAVEAGALVSTADGGQSWKDRVAGGPWDTHELAIHPDAPDTLRVAAGDGYFESPDGGTTWQRPSEGLDVSYFTSVAVDPGSPEVVLVSGASGPHSAYSAGSSNGRLYRRIAGERWHRVMDGWPEPPATVAPILRAGRVAGELWAADERGIHRTVDGGSTWHRIATFPRQPEGVVGLAASTAPDFFGGGHGIESA